MGFHDAPYMRLELIYQRSCIIMRLHSQNGHHLWTYQRHNIIDRFVHREFAINHATGQLEGITLTMDGMEHNKVFLRGVKGHTIRTAPFVHALTADVHRPRIVSAIVELLEYTQIV